MSLQLSPQNAHFIPSMLPPISPLKVLIFVLSKVPNFQLLKCTLYHLVASGFPSKNAFCHLKVTTDFPMEDDYFVPSALLQIFCPRTFILFLFLTQISLPPKLHNFLSKYHFISSYITTAFPPKMLILPPLSYLFFPQNNSLYTLKLYQSFP